ncbi:MAG: amino acid permease [Candidatus Dependentiae bacterium]
MNQVKEFEKLSLIAAIFINLNIMVGVGLFINTTVLAHMVGAAGFVAYATLAILILPLILSIATLVNIYPSGGFYTYAKNELHPLAGFISSWSYFIGKLASATIMIHASMLLLQQIIPMLSQINIFALDIGMLFVFLALNMLHLQAGKSVQIVFLIMKLIPIFFVLFSGLFLLSPGNYTASQFDWSQFTGTIPLVLFAAIGFEATTSLSNNIKNARINGPRAILISYTIVMTINILYQFFFYGILGSELHTAPSFLNAFPLLLAKFFGSNTILINNLQSLFNVAIASSALGGAFGIIFSNSWNLHTLAHNNHIIQAKQFLKENKWGTPYACILAEGAIFLAYLFGTQARQIPLQQIAAFGCSIAYTLSVFSLLLIALKNKIKTPIWIPLFGLLNCIFFLMSCLYSFYQSGSQSLIIFGTLMLIGISMFIYTSKKQTSVI